MDSAGGFKFFTLYHDFQIQKNFKCTGQLNKRSEASRPMSRDLSIPDLGVCVSMSTWCVYVYGQMWA